jgi:hypothetical protein
MLVAETVTFGLETFDSLLQQLYELEGFLRSSEPLKLFIFFCGNSTIHNHVHNNKPPDTVSGR